MYYTICKESGGIEGMLSSIFSFFLRKTDFFYECEIKIFLNYFILGDPGDKMGFPPEHAKKMVIFF